MDQDKLIEVLDRIANALEAIVEHLDVMHPSNYDGQE